MMKVQWSFKALIIKISQVWTKQHSVFLRSRAPTPSIILESGSSPRLPHEQSVFVGDSSWSAVWRKLTKPDWWPGADTDLSPAVGPERSQTQNWLSAWLWLICTQACGLSLHCRERIPTYTNHLQRKYRYENLQKSWTFRTKDQQQTKYFRKNPRSFPIFHLDDFIVFPPFEYHFLLPLLSFPSYLHPNLKVHSVGFNGFWLAVKMQIASN